jgi:hypothetical protein
MFVGILPVFGLLIWLEKRFNLSEAVVPSVVGCFMAMMMITHLITMFWKCPNCRKPFLNHYWWANPWRNTCVWCGQHTDDPIGLRVDQRLI